MPEVGSIVTETLPDETMLLAKVWYLCPVSPPYKPSPSGSTHPCELQDTVSEPPENTVDVEEAIERVGGYTVREGLLLVRGHAQRLSSIWK